MGKFNQGILGGFTGKVGNVVGQRSRGQWIYRGYQKIVANPKSKLQMKQRERFLRVSQLVSKMCRDTSKLIANDSGFSNGGTWFSAMVSAMLKLQEYCEFGSFGRDAKCLAENYFAANTRQVKNLPQMLSKDLGFGSNHNLPIIGNTPSTAITGRGYFAPDLDLAEYNSSFWSQYGKGFKFAVLSYSESAGFFIMEQKADVEVYSEELVQNPSCSWAATDELNSQITMSIKSLGLDDAWIPRWQEFPGDTVEATEINQCALVCLSDASQQVVASTWVYGLKKITSSQSLTVNDAIKAVKSAKVAKN